MTKDEMKDKVKAAHRSVTGYNFEPKIVDEIIDNGEIPVGADLGRGGEWDGSRIITRKDGEVKVLMDAGAATTEKALIAYAFLQSQKGSHTGV